MIVDIFSEDPASNFSPCQKMVDTILSIHKTKGSCEQEDLLSHNFSQEEIDRYWKMANLFAHLDLQEDFNGKNFFRHKKHPR